MLRICVMICMNVALCCVCMYVMYVYMNVSNVVERMCVWAYVLLCVYVMLCMYGMFCNYDPLCLLCYVMYASYVMYVCTTVCM